METVNDKKFILTQSQREKLLQSAEQFKVQSWTGYMCFVVHKRPELRKQNPNVPPKDILKIAGQLWSRLSDEQKEGWGNEAEVANNRKCSTAKATVASPPQACNMQDFRPAQPPLKSQHDIAQPSGRPS